MIVKKDQLIQTPQKIETLAGLTVICTTADSGFLKKNFFNKDLEKFDVIMITEECLLNTSVMNKLYELRDKLLCVIIDEAHELNNYTNAQSANMLKALITKVEYVYALTATPIVSDQIQLAKLANMLLPKEFPSASLLAKKLTSGKLTVEEYPFLFINRKASELGRMSEPKGHVVLVEPQPDQKNCNLGGVKLFQVCKGYGAVNQINALNDVIQSQSGKGLVYVSQKSIMEWVMQNMGKNNISAAVINGEVVGEVRKQIINDYTGFEDWLSYTGHAVSELNERLSDAMSDNIICVDSLDTADTLRKENLIAIENTKRRDADRIHDKIILKKMFNVSHFEYDEVYQSTSTSLSVDADMAFKKLDEIYGEDDSLYQL